MEKKIYFLFVRIFATTIWLYLDVEEEMGKQDKQPYVIMFP